MREAVQNIQAQVDPGGPIELLFVDGRSTDETRALLQAEAAQDVRIRIFDNPDRLTSAGLNIALNEARGEYVARMDAHTTYPTDYLLVGVSRLGRGDVASVSGPQIAEGRDPWSRRVALALSTRLGIGGAVFRRQITEEVEVPSGFTGVWRTDLVRQMGGWDVPAYPNEDAELAARIRAAGGRIVCLPEMAARYVPRNSIRSLSGQYWRYGRARARTVSRHPSALQVSHLLPPALVVVLATVVLGRGRARKVSVAGIGVYGASLAATAMAQRARAAEEAPFIPVVLATMHLSWGAGFLVGAIRLARRG